MGSRHCEPIEMAADEQHQQDTEEIVGTTVNLHLLTEFPIESDPIESDKRYLLQVESGGSGFFVERDKIATNLHVVTGHKKITPQHVDTEMDYTLVGITAFDEESDLAILKVAEAAIPFHLSDSDTVQKGARICAVGYEGNKANRAEGIVRGIRRKDKRLRLKMPDAGPGWSGSPVLSGSGEVVGVLFGGDNNKPDIGYAVPSNTLKALLAKTARTTPEPLQEWQKRPQIRAYIECERGRIHQERDDYETAVAAYNTAINLNPGIPTAYYNRARAKMKAIGLPGTNFKSIDFTDLMEIAMDFHKADQTKQVTFRVCVQRALGRLGLWIARWLLKSSKEFYRRASTKMELGKSKVDGGDRTEAERHYHAAITDWMRCIQLNPKSAAAYNGRGWTKYLLGCLESERKNSREAEWYYHAAITDSDESIRLASADDTASAVYHTRGAARAALGDYEKAVEDFNEAIRLNPETAINHLDRGLAKEALGETDAAKANFEKAIQIDGDLAKHYHKEGCGKNDGRAYEAAMVSFDKALRLNPEYTSVYSNRALSQNALGRRELRRENPEKAKYYLRGAIADCTEAIRLSPKYTAPHNNRGLAKYRLGQSEAACGNSQEAERHYQAAIADLDKAIQLNPKHVKAHRNRGYVKEKLGQQEAAEADFEKAKALDSAAQTE